MNLMEQYFRKKKPNQTKTPKPNKPTVPQTGDFMIHICTNVQNRISRVLDKYFTCIFWRMWGGTKALKHPMYVR